MKKLADIYIRLVQKWLPSPLAIAFGLTAICVILALFFTLPSDTNAFSYSLRIFEFWSDGVWGLLAFTAQMMFILVMGHAIALSKPAEMAMNSILSVCTSHARATFTVTLVTIISGFINWGFGLIIGAVMARKAYEYGKSRQIEMNFPLLAACGYTGMMIWHGGLSGSAPLTVAQPGHSFENIMGIIPLSETIFSKMNLTATLMFLVLLPVFAIGLSKLTYQSKNIEDQPSDAAPKPKISRGSERLDHYPYIGWLIGLAMLVFWIFQLFQSDSPINYLGINTVNFLFFALALISHGSLFSFISATDEAVRGAAGILIQFPLYAGIMGILAGSGLLHDSAEWLAKNTSHITFPLVSFLSAGLVNIFIPSGGGQWQIQGPILIDAAKSLGVDLGKTTMSLAYGDQLTNMLQPFWALPLLSITKLKAKEILPYSIMFMFAGVLILTLILLLF